MKFYYSWKKTRIRVLERQEKKKKGESENGSPDESDIEEKVNLKVCLPFISSLFLKFFSKMDSDDEVQVNAEESLNINEIIGIAKEETEEGTKTGKTSIMTTSTGKTLKRKHDDEVGASEEAFIAGETIPEKKKMETPELNEISITAIPKAPKSSSVSVA